MLRMLFLCCLLCLFVLICPISTENGLSSHSKHHHHHGGSSSKIEDIIVGITTFDKRQSYSAAAIRDTWGEYFAHITYFSGSAAPQVHGCNITEVPTVHKYVRASMEEMYALHTMHLEHPDAPWYYKCDDDAYVNAARLVQLTTHYNSSEDWYIGRRLVTEGRKNKNLKPFCAGGCGYLISNGLMRKIHPLLLKPFTYGVFASDVEVGVLIQEVLGRRAGNVCTEPALENYHYHFYNMEFEYYYPGVPFEAEQRTKDGLLVSEVLANAVGWHYVSPLDMYTWHAMTHEANERHRSQSRNISRP